MILHIAQFRQGAAETTLSKSSKGWKQSVNALQNISDYCQSKNIPFIIIMYRTTPNQLVDEIAQELRILSSKIGFHYNDALPWFDGRDIHLLTNSLVDSHPNAKGHALLAEGIVNLLLQDVFSGVDSLH